MPLNSTSITSSISPPLSSGYHRQGVRRCTLFWSESALRSAPFRTVDCKIRNAHITDSGASYLSLCRHVLTHWNWSDLSCPRDSWADRMCTRVTLQWCKQRLFWPRPATVSSGARQGRQAWSSGVPYELYTHIHRLQTGSTVFAPFIQLTSLFSKWVSRSWVLKWHANLSLKETHNLHLTGNIFWMQFLLCDAA